MSFQFRRFGTTKYKSEKREYGGALYDSKLEVSYAMALDARLQRREIQGWERQRMLRIRVNGKLAFQYKMDFVVDLGNDTYELIETKGFATPEWKIKWRVLECVYDTKEFRIENRFGADADLHLVLESSRQNKEWLKGLRKRMHGVNSPKTQR